MYIKFLRLTIGAADPSLKPFLGLFAGHSLRIAAASNYFLASDENWMDTKEFGDWKSDAYLLYIRQSLNQRLASSLKLGALFR